MAIRRLRLFSPWHTQSSSAMSAQLKSESNIKVISVMHLTSTSAACKYKYRLHHVHWILPTNYDNVSTLDWLPLSPRLHSYSRFVLPFIPVILTPNLKQSTWYEVVACSGLVLNHILGDKLVDVVLKHYGGNWSIKSTSTILWVFRTSRKCDRTNVLDQKGEHLILCIRPPRWEWATFVNEVLVCQWCLVYTWLL